MSLNSSSGMGGRVVDCARLESVYTERYRGFESPPIRQNVCTTTYHFENRGSGTHCGPRS